MYVTAFDKGYAARGIVMVTSLRKFCPDAPVTVLCLDLETELACAKLLVGSGVRIMRLVDLGHDLVSSIRLNREYREFCWTLGAVLCRHLLKEGVDEVVYLDADICFFGNPLLPLQEARKGDLAAVGHNFPTRLKKYEANGVFNVQWVFFRNSAMGVGAAERWAEQCIANCKYDPENGIVGDQKYLDEWPDLYPSFVRITCPGAGVAPWNHEVLRPTMVDGSWRIRDGAELIFFHFHGLKIEQNGLIQLSGPVYTEITELPVALYTEYLALLAAVESQIRNLTGTCDPATWRIAKNGTLGRIRKALAERIVR